MKPTGGLPMEAYTEDDDWPEALEDCDARLLFTTAALLPRAEPLLGSQLTAEQVVVCEGLTPGYPTLSGLGTTSGGPFQACDLPPSAPAAIATPRAQPAFRKAPRSVI